MSYRSLLAPMALAAQEVGDLLLKTPHPEPVSTIEQLREVYGALEAPAEAIMRRHLNALRPGIPWADEMNTRVPETGEVWIVDVIDGAVQFMQDLPQYCVSLALVRDGEPVAAALHAPLLAETYLAAARDGATRNGRPIAPSTKTDTALALLGTSHPPFAREPAVAIPTGRSLSVLLPAVMAVRNLGPTSWQIADTAAGRMDAFWEYGPDEANLLPGALVAREAGALVTDVRGRPWHIGSDSFLAAPRALSERLIELLADV